jgi:hypothetical protein
MGYLEVDDTMEQTFGTGGDRGAVAEVKANAEARSALMGAERTQDTREDHG